MINYKKLLDMFEEKGITSYVIRQKGLIPQSTLQKFRISSGDTMQEVAAKLAKYEEEKGTPFKADVSTKTIEDICQLLQCQPHEIIDWEVELNPDLGYNKAQ